MIFLTKPHIGVLQTPPVMVCCSNIIIVSVFYGMKKVDSTVNPHLTSLIGFATLSETMCNETNFIVD